MLRGTALQLRRTFPGCGCYPASRAGSGGARAAATRPINARTPINCTRRVDGNRNADLNARADSRSVLPRSKGDGISLGYG